MTTTLKSLLANANITRALIVDDAYDTVPRAADLAIDVDEWTNFFDDISEADRHAITEFIPGFEDSAAVDLRDSDEFVRVIWENQAALTPALINPLFARYKADTQVDIDQLSRLNAQLVELGLNTKFAGRDFISEVKDTDIVFIDLYLSSAQRPDDINISIDGLASAISKRKKCPPLVILMSRSTRLPAKRVEFQEKTRLFESCFRIMRKDELLEPGVVNRALRRLAQHYGDSLKLSAFVGAWEDGLTNARDRTTALIRKLGLAEIAQIHHLLLSAEGEPAGSYLVDVFDKVLQHEIEADPSIIKSAVLLNQLSVDDYPPPFVPGANDLLDLVQRSLFHNRARLQLPGSLESIVAFGDVLTRKIPSSIPSLEIDRYDSLLRDIELDDVLAILSPACDLQRSSVSRILLLVGKLRLLTVTDWNYKDEWPKTPIIDLGEGNRCWIKWNVKHFETLSPDELEHVLKKEDCAFEVIARLREAHALELQQKLLATMGRVGLLAPMPATFPMKVEAFLPGLDCKLLKLDIPLLDDGGVCYVGRERESKKAQERLVLTESACEAIFRKLETMDLQTVHERSRKIITRIQGSEELLQALERGIPLPSTTQTDFKIITTPENIAIGLVKRTRVDLEKDLVSSKFIDKAGIILSVFNPDEPNELGSSADADTTTGGDQKKIDVAEPVANTAVALAVATPPAADLKASDVTTQLTVEQSTPAAVDVGSQRGQ